MCEKCAELDEKIEHYKMLSASILDQFTIDGIAKLIAEAMAEKLKLHPEE